MTETHKRIAPAPTVFISYSWDSKEHRAWVSDLANYLRMAGANVLFDGDLRLGQRLPKFMEQSIAKADYVMVICTEKYKAKADGRIGGVGYENNIISGDLYISSGLNEEKYIPVLRSGSWETSLPNYMAGKFGVDCTNGVIDDSTMRDLLTTFGLNFPNDSAKQPDKSRRALVSEDDSGESDDGDATDEDGIKIIGIILDEVTQPKLDGTQGSALYKVPFRLNERPTSEWKQLFLRAWAFPPRFTTMHRPGIASVVGDTIVLDGTTIEEVADYHRDTLVLCVEQANLEYRKLCERREADERRRHEQEARHQSHVADVAHKIRF